MDFVDRASSQLKNLYGAMTPAARVAAALLAAAVVAGMGYLSVPRGAKPEAELMRGVPIAPAQLPAMEAALAKADLTCYEIRGTSIFVPRGREAAYMAALAAANVLPPQLGDAMKEAVRAGSPFMGSRQRDELLKKATQEELSLMIRSMSGIEYAYVIYDEDGKPGFGEQKLITATAGVKPAGATQLDEARVSSIRHLVAGAIAGLKPENVTVCDLNGGGTWHGKLDGMARSGQRESQVPPPIRKTESLPATIANTPPQAAPKRGTPPTVAVEDAAAQWLNRSWGTLVLIGLGLIGLLALRSIARGKSRGAEGLDPEPADSRRASVVPAPHWPSPSAADRSAGEELSRIIDESPETAANILRNWIGQAS